MNITVAELIERLEESDPNAYVQIAVQPSYPLRVGLQGVTDWSSEDDEEDGVVYLVASEDHPPTGSPYASREVWDEAYI